MNSTPWVPLATRMRPQQWSELVGQPHLAAPDQPLARAILNGHLHSMILWGPPGCGKTTFAEVICRHAQADMIPVSAVLSGVKDIRAAIAQAKENQKQNKRTIVFVDEVHRFNKAQQDAFLPHVEAGTITLIGATTENPSFQLNNALLSRTRVYVLKRLTEDDLIQLIKKAVSDCTNGLGDKQLKITEQHIQRIAQQADGDARRCLNLLEQVAELAIENHDSQAIISEDMMNALMKNNYRCFDQCGDLFYEQISALHKSIRGCDPNAAVYWLYRMLDGGCDPAYIARRIVRVATEDIGNADPRALAISIDAWQAYERLGNPEGALALAQAVIYCACAAKSNAVYKAEKQVKACITQYGQLDVPMHLRNASSQLMQQQGYGQHYQYPHDHPNGYIPGITYLPTEIKDQCFYQPVNRGLEIKIGEKIGRMRKDQEKCPEG